MSIKLDNNNKQNQRNRLKEIIAQKIKSQSIAQTTEKSIEEIATETDNEQNLRNRLKKGIIQKTEPLSIAQTPFIKEMESDKEDKDTVETTEEPNRRRESLHAYSKLMMNNNDEQTELDKTKCLRTSTEEEQKPLTWE
jgi:hypothetical protein